jgi:hypothetical protein
MVLDTKKGLLKADKEKGQYVESEKGNDKGKRKNNFFLYNAHARAQKGFEVQRQPRPAIQKKYFFWDQISLNRLGPAGAEGRSRAGRSDRWEIP